jgi:hypothetical protein
MSKWTSKEVGHLRYILERRQGSSVYEMSKLALEKIKGRSLNAVAHKLRELKAEQEFDADFVEIDGQHYPAKVVSGYIVIELEDGSKVPLHIWMWEQSYGIKVTPGYHIHHIDGDRLNNNKNNLALVEASEHIQMHLAGRPPETFALFSFLQEKGLWNDYLDYRESVINLVENLEKRKP